MKHFLSVHDAGNIDHLIQEALEYKKNPNASRPGNGRRIGLIFMNPSLRTRISTQVAAQNLGMEAIVLNTSGDGWQLEFNEGVVMDGKSAEHIKEAAAVMGQYFDIIGVRSFPTLIDKDEDYTDKIINAFKKHAGVPILSLESATRHPLQSLADMITIYEHSFAFSDRKPKVVLMWAPHIKALPQCVANSFAEWVNHWGQTDFIISHPEGYDLDPAFTGGAEVVYDQDKALEGADFIYVKNWSSVKEYGKILPVEKNWMLTNEKLRNTNNGKVMHCLPVRRNLVISDEVLDSAASLVINQAANRVWSAQTAIANLLKNKS